jgi:aspartyl-tRNA(Asn)/glutamyl-tRNA(Gln) amidotransferase subunit A
MKPLPELTLLEAGDALRAKECTVRELWDACAAAAHEKNPSLNAYLELFEADDAAIEAAQARIDTEGAGAPALCGIPLAVKDNILIEGRVASAASKMLEAYHATYDATVVRKLKEAGALFLGRTNMDEFALGGSTENSAFGVTKNPHDLGRIAGGTSGGSAAAVAAHLAIAALGTDTGGSVRNPASHCGIIGLKPTYGAVSRSGVIAAASSFDQVGPMTKTVADAEALFRAVRGADPFDSTTAPDGLYAPCAPREPMTVGVPRALLAIDGIDSGVRARFEETLARLRDGGHELVDIEIPSAGPALAAYYIINFAEVSTNLARFDGIRYGLAKRGETLLADYVESRTAGFGAETRRRILLGTFVLSAGYIDAYYAKANAARRALRSDFDRAFARADVVVTPTMPAPAFPIGEKGEPLSLYLEDAFTVLANLTGMPALSVPMRPVVLGERTLPSGFHIAAPHGAETRLFSLATEVENAFAT